VPGERAVRELLDSRPRAIKELFFEEGRELQALEEQARALGLAVEHRTRDELEEMVGFGLARGVVARAEPPPVRHLDELLEMPRPPGARRRLIVALDQVVDPGNLGAILRSAEFFGAVGVVWAKDRSAPLSPLAVRASAGATERLPLCVVTNLSRALETAKKAGWWVVGTLPEGDEPMGRVARNSPDDLVVVLGGEQRGMRRVTVEACDFKLRIPRVGMLASLNVSAAAAVVLSALGGEADSPSESSDSD
jgi:23S rRNA (guanosine2251-2'-O)-methyltransferase